MVWGRRSVQDELPRVDLRAYADQIRDAFEIEADEEIDFATIEEVTPEIDRRRILLKYFIPDVYEPGRYDRRMDLIDGCIYYLEHLKDTDSRAAAVLTAWQARAGITELWDYADLEESPYGYNAYHPLYSILGPGFKYPGLVIPYWPKHVKWFKGKKRKLDINAHYLFFHGTYHPPEISEAMRALLRLLSEKVQTRPLTEGFRISKISKGMGCKLHESYKMKAEYEQLGVRVIILWNKGALGLDQYLFEMPFPHHFSVKCEKASANHLICPGGKTITQRIITLIPARADWEGLYNAFLRHSPRVRCYRRTNLFLWDQFYLEDFDVGLQDWKQDWGKIVRLWRDYGNTIDQSGTTLDRAFLRGRVIPKRLKGRLKNLLRVCNILQNDGNMLNQEIRSILRKMIAADQKKTGKKGLLPSREEIVELRTILDEYAVAGRNVITQWVGTTGFTAIKVLGTEAWKFELLKVIGEACAGYGIAFLEDVDTLERYLEANYLHTPFGMSEFINYFVKVFDGVLDYKLRRWFMLAPPIKRNDADLYDAESGTWTWVPEFYQIARKFPSRR